MLTFHTGVAFIANSHSLIKSSTKTLCAPPLRQGSSENSGPQQVADPLWERLKALVREVLSALQLPLQQHAGRAHFACAPLSGCMCRCRAPVLRSTGA